MTSAAKPPRFFGLPLAVSVLLVCLAGCGGAGGGSGSAGGDGGAPLVAPTLTPMIINNCACKAYGDPPFTPTLPTSNSPGAIRYSSRNPDVATIDPVTGLVTVLKPGVAQIDAVQAAAANFTAGGTSSSVTVGKGTPRISDYAVTVTWGEGPKVLANPVSNSTGTFSFNAGVAGNMSGNLFTPMQAPGAYTLYITQAETEFFVAASAQGTLTMVSTLPAGYVARVGLTWSPLSTSTADWPTAAAQCAAATDLGRTGWRLPTLTELADYDFSVADRRDKFIWSSTQAVSLAPHDVQVVWDGHHMGGALGQPRGNFSSGADADNQPHYVLCVNTPR